MSSVYSEYKRTTRGKQTEPLVLTVRLLSPFLHFVSRQRRDVEGSEVEGLVVSKVNHENYEKQSSVSPVRSVTQKLLLVVSICVSQIKIGKKKHTKGTKHTKHTSHHLCYFPIQKFLKKCLTKGN